MGKLMEGTADGSTPNDSGTQGGSGGVGSPSEGDIVSASEAYNPGKAKKTGFQDVAGTK